MTSATEVLRRMLDECGLEWGNIRNDGSESDYLTEWQFENNQGKAIAIEWAVGSGLSVEIHRYHLTPEQVIAATLGSCNCSNNCTNSERTETCHDKNGFDFMFGFECTVCGAMTDGYMLSPADMGHYTQFNFCPMCGRRIEQ